MTRCLRPLLLLLALGALSAPVAAAPAASPVDGAQLEQVVLLSRHNLRAPLVEGGVLQQATPHAWAHWEVPAGELTTKGGVLEVYMGRYLRQSLVADGLLPAQGCPSVGSVHAYANSLQRTQATAQFFLAGAFPGCAVAVEQRMPLGTMDPVFNPVIRRDDAGFRARALKAMQRAEAALPLAPSLAELERISDYPQSPACAGRAACHLSGERTQFSVVPGKEPAARGALSLANGMVDAMLMEHYQGVPAAQTGWGRLQSPAQWQALAVLRNGYQDILFGTPEVAREVAAPLLAHLQGVFTDPQAPRVTLLVGHDSNIGSLLAALGTADYTLPGQYEKTPIGGLLRFERWRVRRSGEVRMRLVYVYPTTEQLRDAVALDAAHPPGQVVLQLPGCDGGTCRWADFMQRIAASQVPAH
ncbi:bifunctional glucose-1-phosphatase/inositol phosphatase [Stenotrophomonas sp. 24(2023)]|uniref:bifunctional glucose-1-phosphatase/inositol phosphatase n=1 Tax=Stenotrophomonas sp. 24(2023) TaxID=3068324 RepID=UPI0027DF662E|nr:bifunctional glucose-1-phosphatase/inositol phosphatase [Stenotrophomonas sp. 24(2023)]WMJ68470.1 bifunctional glucose-1-phosphatase/inositol phosphatase [Stenotrophomonas sp. 24(2023)]